MRSRISWVVAAAACLALLGANAALAVVVGPGGDPVEVMRIGMAPPTTPTPVSSLAPIVQPQSAVMLTGVPAYTWTYGCSATSAGMIFGYYDNTGYSNMYTGPVSGGVAPATHNVLTLGPLSLIATMNGVEGRTTAGHVDDYWIAYNSPGPDPWVAGGTEHTWGDCTADYMGTNQWKWDYIGSPAPDGTVDFNIDGSTAVWTSPGNAKLHDYQPPPAFGTPVTSMCHGLRLFTESRGYTVAHDGVDYQNYTQKTDNQVTGGFSFADFMNEIDNNRPVMIQISNPTTGHSMVGTGYDDPDGIAGTADDRIYFHDTWDQFVHTVLWGSPYASMDLQAITVLELDPVGAPALTTVPANGGTLAFGNTLVGTVASGSIQATNTGTGTLTGTFPAASGDFGPGSAQGISLGTGASTSRSYNYTPSAFGGDSLGITITSDGGNSTITLTGTGVAPINSLNTTTVNYGNVRIGDTATGGFTITNVGNGNLSGLGVISNLHGTVAPGAGDFAGAGGLVNLADSAALPLSYAYSPTAAGVASHIVNCSFTNGHTNGTNTAQNVPVTLQGTGVGPSFSTSPAPGSILDFGGVAVEPTPSIFGGGVSPLAMFADSDYILTINNSSTDPDLGALTDLTLISALITGTDASMFSTIGFTPNTLIGVGSFYNLQLRFTAADGDPQGLRTALLTLTTDQNAPAGQPGTPFAYTLQANVAHVPEPTSLALFGLALAAAARRRRRR